MSDPDPRQHGQSAESSDDYRPFNDPKHPSWYSDASAGPAPSPEAVPSQGHAHEAAARNPYADQPLAGSYGNGQPQYPIDGQYPVIANQPRQPGNPYPTSGPGAHGAWESTGRQSGTPYPGGRTGPQASGLAIAAMVLGIVGIVTGGFLLVPQVLAIIMGHLSMKQGGQSRAFAIAGLVMGYLVTGLWVLGIIGFMGVILTY